METAQSSETLVSYRMTTRCNNPEDHDTNLHCCENLKSPIWKHLLFSSRNAAMSFAPHSTTYEDTQNNSFISSFMGVKRGLLL